MSEVIQDGEPIAANSIGVDGDLLNDALRVYIEETSQKSEKSKPWLKEPSNLISLIAVFLTVIGVLYGFFKDRVDSEDKNLQALSLLTLELTKLDSDQVNVILSSIRFINALPASETLRSGPVSPRNAVARQEEQGVNEWKRFANNRRLALLAEADRLTSELGKKTPVNQLMVLATEFQQIYDFEKAHKYFIQATGVTSLITQSMAWKSAGIVSTLRGGEFYEVARREFQMASELLAQSSSYSLISLAVGVEQAWAHSEFQRNDLNASLERLIYAKHLSLKIPCVAGRPLVSGPVDGDIEMLLETAKKNSFEVGKDILIKVSELPTDSAC